MIKDSKHSSVLLFLLLDWRVILLVLFFGGLFAIQQYWSWQRSIPEVMTAREFELLKKWTDPRAEKENFELLGTVAHASSDRVELNSLLNGVRCKPLELNGFSKLEKWQWVRIRGTAVDADYDDLLNCTLIEVNDPIELTAVELSEMKELELDKLEGKSVIVMGEVVSSPIRFGNNYYAHDIDLKAGDAETINCRLQGRTSHAPSKGAVLTIVGEVDYSDQGSEVGKELSIAYCEILSVKAKPQTKTNVVSNAWRDAIHQIHALSAAIGIYHLDVGEYPETDLGLRVLVDDPSKGNWNGPYLDAEIPSDPWGNAYNYTRLAENRYRVSSNGPDGKPETDDDVVATFPKRQRR